MNTSPSWFSKRGIRAFVRLYDRYSQHIEICAFGLISSRTELTRRRKISSNKLGLSTDGDRWKLKAWKESTKHECETTEGTSPYMSGWHQRSPRVISEQLLVIIPQWVSLLSSWLALLSVCWTLDWSVMSRVHEYFTLTWHFNFVPCNRLRHSSQSSKRGTYWSGLVFFFLLPLLVNSFTAISSAAVFKLDLCHWGQTG